MIKITNKELKALKGGEITVKDFAEKLAKNYSAFAIAEAFAELLASADTAVPITKIPISKELFEEHFRFIGDSPRGRKRKDSAE